MDNNTNNNTNLNNIIEPNNTSQSINQNPDIQNNNIQDNVNIEINIKDQLQNIPTVDQSKQEFINNVQNINQETTEQKKEGINFIFIIVLFVIILAAIYFLFPVLLKYI